MQSGGLFEASKVSSALGTNRVTIESYLQALQTTHTIFLVRPFHGGGRKELIKMPKLYAFDTGFVCFAKGWNKLRSEDYGVLWEHVVLEFLLAHFPVTTVHYWRDKAGHELDFVLKRRRDEMDVLECKRTAGDFNPSSLKVFRAIYPRGRNFVVTPVSREVPDVRSLKGLEVHFVSPGDLLQ